MFSKFFFWYLKENQRSIINDLRKMGRPDLIEQLFSHPKGNAYPAPEKERFRREENNKKEERSFQKGPHNHPNHHNQSTNWQNKGNKGNKGNGPANNNNKHRR